VDPEAPAEPASTFAADALVDEIGADRGHTRADDTYVGDGVEVLTRISDPPTTHDEGKHQSSAADARCSGRPNLRRGTVEQT
jgi:hypothetical protein